MFKELMKKVRSKKFGVKGKGKHTGQLPFNFNIMLEYLSNKQRVQDLRNNIDDPHEKFAYDDTTFNKFKHLFKHHMDNTERNLVGMEEVKAKMREEEALEEQKTIIKHKSQMERDRKHAIR